MTCWTCRGCSRGGVELDLRPVSTEALLEAALAPHRVAAEERGVRLAMEQEPGLERVEADPDRLQLVLSNLVANAIRHTPQGGEVVVRAAARGGAGALRGGGHGRGHRAGAPAAHLREVLPRPGRDHRAARGWDCRSRRRSCRRTAGRSGSPAQPGLGSTLLVHPAADPADGGRGTRSNLLPLIQPPSSPRMSWVNSGTVFASPSRSWASSMGGRLSAAACFFKRAIIPDGSRSNRLTRNSSGCCASMREAGPSPGSASGCSSR